MKVAIIGKLETKYDAPFEDDSWEIWSMNSHVDEDLIPRVDKWFDIHKNPTRKKADLTESNFPFEACHDLVHGMRYCTTAAYMIAYAILQGADTIALYGMRFTPDHERRARELDNVRQLIFFAWGRGIEVVVPSDYEYIIPEYHLREGQEFDQ